MTLKLSHTFMIVDDQDKALAFYRDVLGLELKNDVPLGDERWLTVASPEQPGVEIVLVTASMGHSPQDAEALSALLAKGVLGSAIFATDDLAATFERLRDGGRRGAAGADRPAVRGARLRVPRPGGQPPAVLPGALAAARIPPRPPRASEVAPRWVRRLRGVRRLHAGRATTPARPCGRRGRGGRCRAGWPTR